MQDFQYNHVDRDNISADDKSIIQSSQLLYTDSPIYNINWCWDIYFYKHHCSPRSTKLVNCAGNYIPITSQISISFNTVYYLLIWTFIMTKT